MKLLIACFLLSLCLFAEQPSVKMHLNLDEEHQTEHSSRYQNFSSFPSTGQKERHFKGKALCVVSPPTQQDNHPYVGLGIGSQPSYPGQGSNSSLQSTLEGVVGYEFRDQQGHKVVTQLETSQPKARDPTVRFSIGLGF